MPAPMSSRAMVMPAAPAPTMQMSLSMTVPLGTERASTNIRPVIPASREDDACRHPAAGLAFLMSARIESGMSGPNVLLAPIDEGLVRRREIAPFREPQVFPVIGGPRMAAEIAPGFGWAVEMDDARVLADEPLFRIPEESELVIIEIERARSRSRRRRQPPVIEARH